MKTSCTISKIEVSLWKPKVLVLTYYLMGNGAKDRVMIWYPEHKYKKLYNDLQMFCAPIQKIESAIADQLPTQFFLNELNFDSIEFINNQYGFDTVTKHFRGKNGHDDKPSESDQLHF